MNIIKLSGRELRSIAAVADTVKSDDERFTLIAHNGELKLTRQIIADNEDANRLLFYTKSNSTP